MNVTLALPDRVWGRPGRARDFNLTNDQMARIRRKSGIPAKKRPTAWRVRGNSNG